MIGLKANSSNSNDPLSGECLTFSSLSARRIFIVIMMISNFWANGILMIILKD